MQHRRVGELFESVSRPDVDRPAVLHDLLQELAAHVAAERGELEPVVNDPHVGGEDLWGHLVDDYDRMDKLMVLIERRKFNSPDLPGLVLELKHAAEEHRRRAESQLFPRLREMSPDEQDELGAKVSNAESLVTTHPHPHLLSLGPISGLLTRLLARYDWMRDRTVTSQPPPTETKTPWGRGT